MEYSSKVLDHFESPRNVGVFAAGARNVGTGLAGTAAGGDVIRLQIRVAEDGVIAEARFKTFGCPAAIAAASLVTEWLAGRTLDEALAIRNEDVTAELDLPAARMHCSMLAEDAIRAAVADYRGQR